jgi:parvulin-like peptidyl-prolyl isomerase
MKRVWVIGCLLFALVGCGSSTSSSTSANSEVIAKVGTQTITEHQLDIRLASAETALSQAGSQTPKDSNDPMLEQLRADVLRSLISDAVIAQEAEYRHVAITNAEVNAQVASDQSEAGGASALQSQLAQAGGSLDQLKDEIRSQGNEQNLEYYFAAQRADEALAALHSGTPFATVAQEYSDDTTSNSNGGNVGSVSLTTLNSSDPAFAKAVESLSVGETSPAPVRDQAGYEILHLDSHSGSTWSLHRILVSAPQTYTVMNRPQWFAESILVALAQLCSENEVVVYVDKSVQPCSAPASPTPSPS